MPRRPCRPIVVFRTSNDPLFILTLWYVSLSFLKPLVRSLFLLCVIVPLVILIRFSFTCSIAYTTNMHCFLGALGHKSPVKTLGLYIYFALVVSLNLRLDFVIRFMRKLEAN